jgi:hypothetical protein
MSSQPNFLELCLGGTVKPDEIDDFVDRWHEAPRGQELHDYLGMTPEEYSLWLRVPDALPYIAEARREMTPLADAVMGGCRELRRSAQSADRSKIARLEEWLKAKGELI